MSHGDDISGPLPVTVIGGYLGAGKTTLINHLLRHAGGLRLAVLVNEFGALPIDADLIEAEDDKVISITGGCICCSFGSDLVASLGALCKAEPKPDQVLIESSGVALPGSIAGSIGLLQDYCLDGIVVLGDAETLRSRAADRYMGDTIERQIADADLILLNKTDLAAPDLLEATVRWLQDKAPEARVIATRNAAVPPQIVLGRHLERAGEGGRTSPDHAVDLFETLSLAIPGPVEANRLAKALADPTVGLIRAKGFVPAKDGSTRAVQVVGRRWAVSAAPAGVRHGLVCIGLKAQIKVSLIERLVAASGLSPAPPWPSD